MTANTIDAPAPSTTERPMIYAAMAACLKDMEAVGKEGQNRDQNYKFRSIEDVMTAVRNSLSKHGVFFLPTVLTREPERRQTSGGKAMNTVHLEIRYDFFAVDGSSVSATVWGEGADTQDKATNKAMSAALKYCLVQAFSIAAGDIEDSDRSAEDAGHYHSAGEAFDRAVPADQYRQRQNGNGHNGNGHRPNGSSGHNGNGNGQQQRPAGPVAPPPLVQGDPWKDRIADVATSDEANALHAEIVQMQNDGTIDVRRRNILEAHLRWHMAHRAVNPQPDQSAAPAAQAPAEPAPPAASNGTEPTGDADPWRTDPPDTEDPWGEQPQAPAAEQSAPAASEPASGEQDWITGIRQVLADAQTADALSGLQQQITQKITTKAITPAVGGQLTKELQAARRRVTQMAGTSK